MNDPGMLAGRDQYKILSILTIKMISMARARLAPFGVPRLRVGRRHHRLDVALGRLKSPATSTKRGGSRSVTNQVIQDRLTAVSWNIPWSRNLLM